MAKRKDPKRRKRSQADSEKMPDLPDRRVIEGRMWQDLRHSGEGEDAGSRLREAQDLIYQAFESPDSEERVRLARQALEICPDCADAYVLLAEHAPSRKEALELYEKGVAAGERALGERTFREQAGHFWGLLETRPYMRAREGLAQALWAAGRREEAVRHLQDLLRLNPNDNQGLRYLLAEWLLHLDQDEDLGRLLQQYEQDGSATWAYTRALLAFRQGGETPEARKLLKEARKTNKHVPAYLLGQKPLPPQQPPY
jgi:tetratricopeptide (TPR) repeat protein